MSSDWPVSVGLDQTRPSRRPLFTARHLDLQTLEAETATIADKKTEAVIAKLERQHIP